MPASHQSKITFDAINIVRAENIYLTESKKDRTEKRKTTTPTDEILHQKKKLISEVDLRTTNLRPSSKTKKSHNSNKSNSNGIKLKNTCSVVTAATKSRKRQLDIGNAYSKLNSQVKNQPKPSENTKTVLSEQSDSRSSFYLTPREEIQISEIDFENINPNRLPGDFYECELDEFIRSQYPDFEDTSEYDFHEPLVFENFDLPPEMFHPKNSSLRHFKELLDQEKSSENKLLQKSELELLKDIVKADERYQKLKRDDYKLIKEILEGQLKEISEQERVIKIALEKIRFGRHQEVEVESLKVAIAEQPMENRPISEKILLNNSIITKTERTKNENSGQEVDVFFKNVPSLEREIRILKQLGLKLEETLKKSTDKAPVKPPLSLQTVKCISFSQSINIASSRMLPYASKSIIGLAQEFKISHQTINELKLERDFYIEADLDNFTLQRTNFNLMRHNPELLLRKLKPITKDSRVKFNFIEQDPMFFNHFLEKICKIASESFAEHETFIPKNQSRLVLNQKPTLIPAMAMSGAGDHCDFIFKDECSIPPLEPPAVMQKTNQKIIGRKKYKQSRTPMNEKDSVSPKNGLLKTFLLGSLHLTIALIVFTAILYPDVVCF